MQKHGFWPVPSYGLRKAHSPSLVEGVVSENRGRKELLAPLALALPEDLRHRPYAPTSMKKPYTSGNAATPIKGLITKILLWGCCGDLRANG